MLGKYSACCRTGVKSPIGQSPAILGYWDEDSQGIIAVHFFLPRIQPRIPAFRIGQATCAGHNVP